MTTKCDVCGDEYNQFLDQRFWSGDYGEIDGKKITTLCDDCHRELTDR